MSNPTIDNTLSNTNQDGDGRFVAVETYTSRRASLDEGREQRSREFIVYSNQNPPQPLPDASSAVSLTNVQYGDAHPENPLLFAVDVDVRVSPDAGRAAYLVTWNYRAVSFEGSFPGQNETPENPEAPDYQEFNLATDPTLVDVWRVPPFGFLPEGGNLIVTDDPQDIGGIPIDARGIPASYLVRRGTFEVTRNIPFAEFDSKPLLEAGGARNEVPFLGFPAGNLLYLGARSTRVSQGVIRITHEMGYDEFFHLGQKPDTDPVTGEIRLSQPDISGPGIPGGPPPTEFATEDADGNSITVTYENRHAHKVTWYQPYPRLLDFYTLGIVGPGFFPP